MRFLFLAPLPSAFGEVVHGAPLAAALVARGHEVVFAAPSIVAPAVPTGVPFQSLDDILTTLDVELAPLCARLGTDALVLVEASGVDKFLRALHLSRDRIANAAPHVVSLDCWNLVDPPRTWDYGPVSEPLDPWFIEHTPVIRPAPLARADARGAYAALPSLALPTREQRALARARFGLPERGAVVAWPMARWQLPESHDNAALAEIAARLPALLAPSLAALGDDITIAHVSPAPLAAAHRPSHYHHIDQLPAHDFAALIGCTDVLLGFNATATSFSTALRLEVPTLLCAPRDETGRRLWMWPLCLEGVVGPTVRDNPFFETMTVIDSVGDPLVAALRTLAFDASVRDETRAAQVRYRETIDALPDGADRLLAAIT